MAIKTQLTLTATPGRPYLFRAAVEAVAVDTPTCRIYTVEDESRIYMTGDESRVYIVEPESRVYLISC